MKVCERCNKPLRLGYRFCSYYCVNGSPEERFWSKVDKTGPCWLWTASTVEFGYGRIRWEGRAERAHRVSYVISKGAIPQGKQVLHRCDVPACVNPSHLYVGTDQDNAQDRMTRGRLRTGERAPLSKFSNSTIASLRKKWISGKHTAISLAKMFHMSPRHVRDVVAFKWRKTG